MPAARAAAAAPPAATPIDAGTFERLMAPFAPFEPAPEVAVAVSGGPDSLALTLLLDAWARARGGRILAVTVDHRLRPESAAEARWVGEVCAARGIAHETVRWQGPPPDRARQAQAREERYTRLREVCAGRGILHLAIAHHRDDRAETVLLRLEAGSRLDGLAGMAHQREMPELRVIRPLIGETKDRLKATLRAQGLDWIEDPTNVDPAFARPRLRRAMPLLAAEGLDAPRINEFAGLIGRARRVVETAQNRLLAGAVALHPAGFARLDPQAFAAAPERVARGALARVLLAVGGLVYPPRQGRLERLHAALPDGLKGGRTLGGCRVVPRRDGRWLVVREAGRAPRFAVRPGEHFVYDGRWELTLSPHAPADLEVGPLGRDGWAALTAGDAGLRRHPLPPPVRPALTALFDADGVREVPALGWVRRDAAAVVTEWAYAPRRALTGAGFTVARDERHIIS